MKKAIAKSIVSGLLVFALIVTAVPMAAQLSGGAASGDDVFASGEKIVKAWSVDVSELRTYRRIYEYVDAVKVSGGIVVIAANDANYDNNSPRERKKSALQQAMRVVISV